MPDDPLDHAHQHWLKQLEGIDLEIAREAIICGIPLLAPGVVERVLRRDTGVCSHANPIAFDKLHALLIMHFAVRDRAVQDLGEHEIQAICQKVRDHLRGRVGQQLGGPGD